MSKSIHWSISALLLLLSGCASMRGILDRETHAHAFLAEMDESTAQALADPAPLTLDQCIVAALKYNLNIKTADLEARLAKLKRRVAFANFLPEISVEYTSVELNKAPASTMIAGLSTQVQDRIVRDTAVQAQMPIFAPATWFLYAAHQRGEEIGILAAEYVRQMITLQVTGLYFQSLATTELQRTLEAQRGAAAALAFEVEAYHREGMATDADLAQVRVLLMARENALKANALSNERTLAELLAAMGLSPMEQIALEASHPLQIPKGELADWILEALLNNPRLFIADRQAAIEREKTRIAIADFLPMLAGFASRSHTSNSFMTYPYASAMGFTGLMTVFNGFANINEYRAARVQEEKAWLAREQESLAVMLEVIKIHSALDEMRSALNLADAAAAAEKTALAEQTARMREGLLRPSEILETVAKHDAAQVNAANARYQEQVLTAMARSVLGSRYRTHKEAPHD